MNPIDALKTDITKLCEAIVRADSYGRPPGEVDTIKAGITVALMRRQPHDEIARQFGTSGLVVFAIEQLRK